MYRVTRLASAVLAEPTRALQGTNRGSGLVMEESENGVGSLEQLLLFADEHYLAGKLPLVHKCLPHDPLILSPRGLPGVPDQPAVFMPMIMPLSDSLNCEKCLLARLPGMFRLPKCSIHRWVIVTFMKLRMCAGLHSTLFLIVALPRRV
ncbi:uncharacterized protein TNCV_467691 [Trichonephila clavipes]|nr:uncharacterized protein TNCV_467691 [Trichonephila clavipes]